MYYTIKNNNIYECGNSPTYMTKELGIKETDIITYEEYNEKPNKVIIQDGILVLNPDYEQEEEEKERQRVANLTCTKRVFVLMLEQLGFDYFTQIQPLINANRQAKLEWELCVELQRKNPLLDIVASEIGVTSEQLDKLFKFANDEINQEEFLNN